MVVITTRFAGGDNGRKAKTLQFCNILLASERCTLYSTRMQMLRSNISASRMVPALLGFAFLSFLAINHEMNAQPAASEEVVVTGEEVPSAYGAPPAFSRSRFSPLTNAYVL